MSQDPIRLRDDPEAARGLREDLVRTAEARPSGFDAQAGLTRLQAAIRAEGVPGAAEGGNGTASSDLLNKLGWWGTGILGTGAIVVAVWVLSSRPSPPAAPVTTPRPPAAAPSTEVERSEETQVRDERPEAPPDAPAARSGPTEPQERVVTPRVPRDVAPADADDDRIRREIEQLARARASLTPNPALALELAEAGHREFPDGILRQEREAIAIFALQKLGRSATARDRALRFLTRYRYGPFTERIQRLADSAADESAR